MTHWLSPFEICPAPGCCKAAIFPAFHCPKAKIRAMPSARASEKLLDDARDAAALVRRLMEIEGAKFQALMRSCQVGGRRMQHGYCSRGLAQQRTGDFARR